MMAESRDWESYSDSKILYLRPLTPNNETEFEYVAVCSPLNEVVGMMELHHGVVYVDDYFSPEARPLLDGLLNGFGYAGLEGFVKESAETDGKDWVRRLDGSVDTAKSPSWFIDYRLLASLIIESKIVEETGILMTNSAADRMAGNIIGVRFSY